MKRKWKSVLGCLLLVSVPLFANPGKPPRTTPIEAIKELDKMADQYRIGKNLTKADEDFNRQLKEDILRGTFNLRELAKLALAKHWNEHSAKEQDQFVELLTNLLEERSLFAKEKAAEKDETKSYGVQYKTQAYLDKDKTNALVNTVVKLTRRKTKIGIDYKLKKTPEGIWRIYDVIVDDASLVDNYRSSFGKIIQEHGYSDLLQRMQNKLKEFRGKRIENRPLAEPSRATQGRGGAGSPKPERIWKYVRILGCPNEVVGSRSRLCERSNV